jgi:uncharacterized protein YjbI with pentapeptide repeats
VGLRACPATLVAERPFMRCSALLAALASIDSFKGVGLRGVGLRGVGLRGVGLRGVGLRGVGLRGVGQKEKPGRKPGL